MRRTTSYADRQEIVTLREAGNSYRAIAQKTGWSFEIVGKFCRAYQERPGEALEPKRPGRPGTGPLSTFDSLVK
jgi:transposase-like protein